MAAWGALFSRETLMFLEVGLRDVKERTDEILCIIF